MFQILSPHLVQVAVGDARQAKSAPRLLKIRIGQAFPATHPTSRLCLELLGEALAARPVHRVIDVGCGAGVLSLAAAALGAQLVVAVDLAREAVLETRENARRNALAGSLRMVRGSTECVKGSFDLVMANLPLEVQMDKAPELSRLAAPAGSLLLSGFRDRQESRLQEAYQELGWSLSRRLIKDFRHPELPPDLSFTWVAWLLKRSRD